MFSEKELISHNSNEIATNTINISTNTQAINDMMTSNDMYSGDMYSGDMDHHNNTVDKCTGDYMSISGEYCGEWVGAKIVKLPMWGAQEEDSDNYFEYPSSEGFAGMQPDVQLKSI